MIIVHSVLVLSFLLDGAITRVLPTNTLFLPLCTLVSLVIIYPYFNNKDEKFFTYCAVVGLLFDLVYTTHIGIHILTFPMIGFLIKVYNIWLSNNIVNTVGASLIAILLYRFFTYVIAIIGNTIEPSWSFFIKGIYSSILFNLIYVSILFLITHWLSKKYRILKFD